MTHLKTRRILSTAGIAASLVGFCAMTATQANAAGPGGSSPGKNSTQLAGIPVGQVIDQVPVLKGNGVNNR
ncbi:hypothetical protein [Streptomyces sp. ODS28]|uniref:hypothetical protein n=1 Tax=Streptomyces sp. ODS28 TaxID=3136688 RepID=UPI0031E6C7BD